MTEPSPPSPPLSPPPAYPPLETKTDVFTAQAALFVGACISIVACCTVIYKYYQYRTVRRPPLSLLFWRTISDLAFSLNFIFGLFIQLGVDTKDVFWGELDEYANLCSGLAFYMQFTIFSAEMWFLVICVDLVLSLTQPFRQQQADNPKYHLAVWLSSLVTGLVLIWSRQQGAEDLHICWVRADNTTGRANYNSTSEACSDSNSQAWEGLFTFTKPTIMHWLVFYGWLVLTLLFSAVVVVFATARLSVGLQATYEIRLGTIKDLRLIVASGFLYWLAVGSAYVGLNVNCFPEFTSFNFETWNQTKFVLLWVTMALTIALKGLVDALLWHKMARRLVAKEREQQYIRSSTENRTTIAGSDGHRVTANAAASSPSAKHGGDVSFGVPEALREEWLDYTQLGIRTAVEAAEEAVGTTRAQLTQRVLMLPAIQETSHASRAASERDLPNVVGETAAASNEAGGNSSTLAAPLWTAEGRATEYDADELERCCAPCSRSLMRCTMQRVKQWLALRLANVIAYIAGGGPPFPFTEYHPGEFLRLRSACGVHSETYLGSLIRDGQVWVKRTKEGKGGRWSFSEGKSGSFMYFTSDRTLLVKTIDETEASVLHKHAAAYVRYMIAHPQSYLTRFYGLYSITMYNTTVHFVVMANVFAEAVPRPPHEPLMDERYDLKGSWVDRNSSRPKDPNALKKDSDLNYCLHLSSQRLELVQKQMSADVSFLHEELHTMDYSLLVGVRRGRFIVTAADDGQTQLQPVDTAAPTAAQPPPTSSSSEAAASRPTAPAMDRTSSPSPRASLSSDRGRLVGTASPLALGLPRMSGSQRMSVSSGEQQLTEPAARSSLATTQPLLAERPALLNSDSQEGAANGSSPRGIELASIVEGPQSYHMGIIDILQRWTVRKRLERLAKSWRRDAWAGISAVPPGEYAKRFTERVIFDVFDAPELEQEGV